MVDNILLSFPEYDQNIAKVGLNDHLRALIARRPWSGLVKFQILQLPALYNTGTVAATFQSNVLTGTSTAWATNDVVNTTLSIALVETGILDITPASMIGITTSQWLLIDGGNAGEEAVYVISVNTQEGTFRARTTVVHAAAVTIKCSSLAGRQVRISLNVPFLTITGVSSTTRLLTDKAWPVASVTAQGYSITKVYTTLGDDVKELLTMVNTKNQYQFDLTTPKPALDWMDPLRTATNYPYALVFHETDPAGTPMWELYPRPTVESGFPYFYVKQWAPLEGDNDFLPNGIRSDVMVKLVKADAARWPGHKLKAGGVYYDPRLGDTLANEAQRDLGFMMTEDDNTAIMSMYWSFRKWPIGLGGGGPNFFQIHDIAVGEY